MATIAEMIAASGLQSSQQAPDLTGNLAKGAELAQTMQKLQMQRQELEGNKAGAELAKIGKTMELVRMAHEADKTDKALAASLWKHAIPAQVRALGTDKVFTPEFIETASKSPQTREKALGYQMEIQERIANRKEGETPQGIYNEVLTTISDPAVRSMLDTDRLLKAQEQKAVEVEAEKRARINAEASMGKQIQAQQAAPRVAEATEKAKGRVKFLAEEKAAGESAIESLEDVAKKLQDKTSKVKTGSLLQTIPGLRSDAVQSVLSPETVAAKTQAQSALNAVLRQTLGAQFTQQEGERVLNQIWDDKQPNAENARRILLKVKQLKSEMKAKGETLGAGAGPRDGDTKVWEGKTYKVVNGQWVQQ